MGFDAICYRSQSANLQMGESDRLFAQSPALLKVIAYLEAQSEPPEDLLDECQALLVNRDSSGEEQADLIF